MTPDIKRILVPLDFSSNSALALDYAYALAQKFDAALHLVHVCEVPSMMTASMDAYAIAYTDWSQRLGDEAERELTKLLPALARVKVSTEVLFGTPARAIVTAAGHQRRRPDRDGHAWPRRRDAHGDGQRGGARGADGVVPGAHRARAEAKGDGATGRGPRGRRGGRAAPRGGVDAVPIRRLARGRTRRGDAAAGDETECRRRRAVPHLLRVLPRDGGARRRTAGQCDDAQARESHRDRQAQRRSVSVRAGVPARSTARNRSAVTAVPTCRCGAMRLRGRETAATRRGSSG